MGRITHRKSTYRAQAAHARLHSSKFNKENIPLPETNEKPNGPPVRKDWHQSYRNEKRKNHRLRARNQALESTLQSNRLQMQSVIHDMDLKARQLHTNLANHHMHVDQLHTQVDSLTTTVHQLRKSKAALLARLKRMVSKFKEAVHKSRLHPIIHKLKHGRTYTSHTRALARALVLAGCTQQQVGSVIETVARSIGVSVTGNISRRTVGRVILEGGVASKIQLGSEILGSQGM
jgi:tetrahydromethanopterin S-methyltransferase subunit F